MFQTETDYLRFWVTEDEFQMREDYVGKILNWSAPTAPKDLSSFLGFTSYYCSFIPKYSALTGIMETEKQTTPRMDRGNG